MYLCIDHQSIHRLAVGRSSLDPLYFIHSFVYRVSHLCTLCPLIIPIVYLNQSFLIYTRWRNEYREENKTLSNSNSALDCCTCNSGINKHRNEETNCIDYRQRNRNDCFECGMINACDPAAWRTEWALALALHAHLISKQKFYISIVPDFESLSIPWKMDKYCRERNFTLRRFELIIFEKSLVCSEV